MTAHLALRHLVWNGMELLMYRSRLDLYSQSIGNLILGSRTATRVAVEGVAGWVWEAQGRAVRSGSVCAAAGEAP